MAKNLQRFQDLHEDYVDALEYLATYGMDSLSDKEQVAARKLAFLSDEFISVVESEDPNYDEKEEDDEY
jgi:hypothetical protein